MPEHWVSDLLLPIIAGAGLFVAVGGLIAWVFCELRKMRK